MNRLRMAARLRRYAEQLEREATPEPAIRTVDLRIYGYDDAGAEVLIANFVLLPNSIFSTQRLPLDVARMIRVEARPAL